jgi:hypothetical protein
MTKKDKASGYPVARWRRRLLRDGINVEASVDGVLIVIFGPDYALYPTDNPLGSGRRGGRGGEAVRRRGTEWGRYTSRRPLATFS